MGKPHPARPFNIPTDDEIERAYQAMMREMNDGNADKMGRMTSRNRMLQYQIRGILRNAASFVEAGAMPPALAMESSIGSAMAYGLQLGIHIGLARAKEKIQ